MDELVQSGKYQNWKEITPLVNKELFGDDETQYRDESAFRKSVKYARDFYEAGVFGDSEDEYFKKLQIEKREIQKERAKFQTEKLEYNKWLREEARDELITEKICDAITALPPLEIPEKTGYKCRNRIGCLIWGDEHFGTEFELYGLFGEVINSYSPDIFYKRMWDLLHQTIDVVKKEDLDELHLYSMGDFADGILRVSQLMKLRYGVVESTVLYADFICNWLNELSKHINIKFQMVKGNHTELRMLSQPKGTFTNENMDLVVKSMIKTRLAENPNFKMIENPTGMIYDEIFGLSILGIHGEVKSMEKAIKDFSHTYGVKISYLIAGHLHHSKSEVVGVNCETINVPSIIGIDDYSLSLNKISNAGATLLIMEEGKGKTIEYSLKLN